MTAGTAPSKQRRRSARREAHGRGSRAGRRRASSERAGTGPGVWSKTSSTSIVHGDDRAGPEVLEQVAGRAVGGLDVVEEPRRSAAGGRSMSAVDRLDRPDGPLSLDRAQRHARRRTVTATSPPASRSRRSGPRRCSRSRRHRRRSPSASVQAPAAGGARAAVGADRADDQRGATLRNARDRVVEHRPTSRPAPLSEFLAFGACLSGAGAPGSLRCRRVANPPAPIRGHDRQGDTTMTITDQTSAR